MRFRRMWLKHEYRNRRYKNWKAILPSSHPSIFIIKRIPQKCVHLPRITKQIAENYSAIFKRSDRSPVTRRKKSLARNWNLCCLRFFTSFPLTFGDYRFVFAQLLRSQVVWWMKKKLQLKWSLRIKSVSDMRSHSSLGSSFAQHSSPTCINFVVSKSINKYN